MPLTHTWTGWDASTWDLTSGEDGVRLVTGSVRGMNMPPVQQYRTESPMVAGSRYRGTRILQREVFWPLMTSHDGTETQFQTLDRAFWKTMDPAKVGTWTITRPSGASRSLTLRFESADDGMERDPLMAGYGVWGITLVAEQPFWAGEATTITFTDTGTEPIENLGDVPAWITWTLHGPIGAGAHIGMTNAHILIPVAIPSGDTLTVYTQPDLMIALWDDGTELILDSSPDDYTIGARFAAVPEGGDTNLSVVIPSGAGTVDATLIPYHFRAY